MRFRYALLEEWRISRIYPTAVIVVINYNTVLYPVYHQTIFSIPMFTAESVPNHFSVILQFRLKFCLILHPQIFSFSEQGYISVCLFRFDACRSSLSEARCSVISF